MRPKMIVVAGPPGSGKSTAFPVNGFGVAFFNADDRAAELNGGSYRHIRIETRREVNGEFEEFVREHIDHRESFAIETTLRSDVTFDQVSLARECGFECIMRYVALSEFEMNAARVAARGQLGGHSAPVEQLFRIYEASLANLPRALREMDEVRVYDNSSPGAEPAELMVCIEQSIVRRSPDIPGWLVDALSGTEFALA